MRTKWEPLLEDSAQSRVAVAARDLFVIVQQCITKSSFLLQNHPTQNYDKLIWDNFEQMCKLSGIFYLKKKKISMDCELKMLSERKSYHSMWYCREPLDYVSPVNYSSWEVINRAHKFTDQLHQCWLVRGWTLTPSATGQDVTDSPSSQIQ